jgi:hypothetical protein
MPIVFALKGGHGKAGAINPSDPLLLFVAHCSNDSPLRNQRGAETANLGFP